MKNQIIITIIFSLISSTFSFANEKIETYQQELLSINFSIQNKTKNESCLKLNTLSNNLEMDLFQNTCPNSSDLDYNICQQSSDSLNYTETKKLQIVLSEIKKINNENCNLSVSKNTFVVTAH